MKWGMYCETIIDTIRMTKMPINWATLLSNNLREKLVVVKDNLRFYMTSYMVYLIVARTTNYLGLYKKGSYKMLMLGPMWYILNW
jgi:hypothetical protein